MGILGKKRAADFVCSPDKQSVGAVNHTASFATESEMSAHRHSVEPTGVDAMFGGRHPVVPVTETPDIPPTAQAEPPAATAKPDSQQMRLIGKLEALLSLAEKHRLMIEQQRRNIDTLNIINRRQSRELQYLRHRLERAEQVAEPNWRRFFDRFSRLPNV